MPTAENKSDVARFIEEVMNTGEADIGKNVRHSVLSL